MKVLMCVPGTPHSPISHRALALGRELVKRGHQVTMLAPSRDKYSKWELDNDKSIEGIKLVYPWQFRTKIQVIALLPYLLHASFLAATHKQDIAYSLKATPANLPIIFAKLRGAKLVLDLDDLDAEVMQAQGQPRLMWKLVQLSERLLAAQATGFMVASRLLQNEYAHRFPKKPLLRISNAVDPAQFPLTPKAKRPPRILFFGMLGRTSLLAPLLTATAQVKDLLASKGVTVEILGDGPSRPQLEAMSHQLSLDPLVNFHGFATYQDFKTSAAYGDIAICVMPQERTTAACSNQKVFQYMALGLAPIVSSVGDLPLYVAEGKAGLVVPPEDPEALAQAITKLIEDSSLRELIASQAHQRVVGHYTWGKLADQVAPFLEGLS